MNLSLRQAGLLHRARRATVSTPLPSWSYMAALPPSEPLVSIIIELVRSLRHGAGVSVGSVCDARRFLNVVEIRALPRDPAPCHVGRRRVAWLALHVGYRADPSSLMIY